MNAGDFGAYGLALPDLKTSAEWFVEAPRDWPRWTITHADRVTPGGDQERLTPDHARLLLSGSAFVDLDRVEATVTYRTGKRPSDEEIIHPFIALPAAMAARWRGWQSFHAGSFVVDGGVWGILGDKGAGKSSLLASLALDRGLGVMADDVLVIDDAGRAYAGPRCMDLRRQAAEAWGVGAALGTIGARERWRVPLPGVPAVLPLRGWVHLAWGDRLAIEHVGAIETFERLGPSLALRVIPPDPAALLDLAGLPSVRLVRPHEFAGIAASADLLVDVLTGPIRPG